MFRAQSSQIRASGPGDLNESSGLLFLLDMAGYFLPRLDLLSSDGCGPVPYARDRKTK